tara:strand:+ start:1573 stop:2589 length:1017 start_codon:yes stop_codon:yes gene_type:complete
MSTDIEIPDQNDKDADEAALGTLAESNAGIDLNESAEINADLSDSSENDTGVIELGETADTGGIELGETADTGGIELDETNDDDDDESDEADTSMGEWSLCASMIFLAGYLVVLLCSLFGPDLIDVTVSTTTVDGKEVVNCVDGDILTIDTTKFEIDFSGDGFTAGNVQVIVQTGDTSLDIAKAITTAINTVGLTDIREATAHRMPLAWFPFTEEIRAVVRITCARPVTFSDNSNTAFNVATGSIFPRSLIYFDKEDPRKRGYTTDFPVGVATILLLISILSAFCALMSLVADKNNRNTMLIRLLTLGPLLPTATAGFMIWVIIERGAGNSILETILG